MKKIAIALAMVFVASIFGAQIQAQTKVLKEVTVKASTYEKSRGADENITKDKPAGDVKANKPAEKERGSLCYVYINNYTPYAVDIYVDGEWMGTISSYSSAYTYAYSGRTKLYGKSVGGTYYWGPSYFDCAGQDHTWNLWE